MNQAPDPHLRFRELLSDRLDGALPVEDEEALRSHLAGCPPCRTIDRDYRDQRRLLAALPILPPPRDLWARTDAALDRELARSRQRGRRPSVDDLPAPRRLTSPLLMVSSLASLALALVVVATQLDQGVSLSPPPSGAAAVAPTPFDIPTQELAFVDFSAGGLTVYQAAVSEVCPQGAIDCNTAQLAAHPVARIPGKLAPRGLALHPDDRKLALLAEDDLGSETITVVLLPPAGASEGNGTGLGPDGVGRTAPPAASPPAGSASSSQAISSPTGTSGSSAPPTKGPGSGGGQSSGASGAPSPGDAGTSSPSVTPRPARTPPGSPASSGAAGSPSPAASAKPTSDAPGSPIDDPGDAAAPTLVPADVVAILEGVHTTGAPPAWSPDGSMLAFSAMPADRSQGPDVYTWRAGDARAQRLTTDHRSDFASWSGSRLVVSREPARGATGAAATTIVVDPATGEERAVSADGLWLPVVDPTGRWAVGWLGVIGSDEGGVDLRTGGLYVIDWRALDPFRERKETQVETPTPAPTERPTKRPRAGGGNQVPQASDEPSADPAEPSIQATPGVGQESLVPVRHAGKGQQPEGQPPAQGTPNPPLEPPTTPVPFTDLMVQAVEPDRDVRADPVVDWQVAWSDDGSTFGYWVADTPGANWGRLSVMRIARDSGRIDRESQILQPTLARRAFAIGADRVAWVAPSDDGTDGELRVRAWGATGDGGLRIRDVNVEQAVPAF